MFDCHGFAKDMRDWSQRQGTCTSKSRLHTRSAIEEYTKLEIYSSAELKFIEFSHVVESFDMALRVIVFFLVMGSASMAFAKQSLADVTIVNSLPPESPPLHVHCKNRHKHDALSEHTVSYQQSVVFGFKPNQWGTTRYTCEFTWNRYHQEFPVWVDDYFFQTRPCTHCVWTVTVDGFFRNEAADGRFQQFVYYWKI
ncbi:hypothetical protein KC19_8G098800 [Ceratodon purpureus]|uniref:S-protein homolog n=1 Tax=Ceratodon purpureus TaxID=3225 RepID=A0A8T0H0M9_CERPU|nr:hypothetical protein KC19_8G098800 [Ceratodon purpureus]